MKRPMALILASLLPLLLAGCAPYVDDFQFVPRPAVAQIPATQPSQPPPVEAWASVIGVRRADRHAGVPDSVEISLRVENDGAGTVLFDPRTMELSDGIMAQFPEPLIDPPQNWTLEPGQSAQVRVNFPFLPGHDWDNTDLNSLQLRWAVDVDGRVLGQTVFFRRQLYYYYYYSPYYDYYPVGFYGSFVFVGHGGHRR
jgi:hypothetical protein